MKRKAVGLSIAAVLAVFGTFVLVAYVQSAHDSAAADERLVDVLVVKKTVARGTAGSDLEGLVKIEEVPAKLRAEGAVSSLRELQGKVASTDLVPGEQVIADRFAQRSAAGVGAKPGQLQVTVGLDAERALGGNVRSGDSVAVLASFDPFEIDTAGLPNGGPTKTPNTTHLILHKVAVTNVQLDPNASTPEPTEEGEVQKAATGKVLVTLAVDAAAVERVVFAAEHGTLWLSAEPGDAPEAGTKVVTRGNVY